MKNSKLMMPVMALGFAVSLAFANKVNVQSAGWIDRNGGEQLQNDPCNSGTNQECRVRFSDDPNTVYQVYETSNLQNEKLGGIEGFYTIVE